MKHYVSTCQKLKSLGQAFSKTCREPPAKGRSPTAVGEIPLYFHKRRRGELARLRDKRRTLVGGSPNDTKVPMRSIVALASSATGGAQNSAKKKHAERFWQFVQSWRGLFGNFFKIFSKMVAKGRFLGSKTIKNSHFL